MKILSIALCISALLTPAAFAEKPDWAGKSKQTTEQKEARKAMQDATEDIEEGIHSMEEKMEKADKAKKSDELKGADKQRAKKSEQEQKELNKGSAKGQESRDANRKKWWKFWGD
ncbi:hypothetical protein [Litorivivens sp.]|uniref:hypothetical protein n=1 Tax=Litorivivens sp. TaxID=2020868 RepID=UPI0035614B80